MNNSLSFLSIVSNTPLRFFFTSILSLVMIILVPYHDLMVVYPPTTPELLSPASPLDFPLSTFNPQLSTLNIPLSHILYMFAHANFLHCIINAWCLIALSTIITPLRFSLAMLFGFLISFTPAITAPTVGFSVILFYFYGYLARILYYRSRIALYTLILFMFAGLFIPWIAAYVHLSIFLLGFLSWHIESLVRSFISQITQ